MHLPKNRYSFLGSDCNAVVGQQSEFDNPTTIGKHGLGIENSRGQWLKQWCTLEGLVITNTKFPKRDERKVTHIGPTGNQRQIDYIMIDRCFASKVFDSGSVHFLDLGSDHKTVLMRLVWKRRLQSKRIPKTPVCKSIAWAETDSRKYLENATKIVDDLKLEVDLDTRCHQIEQALLLAAKKSSDRDNRCISTYDSASGRVLDTQLMNMIQQRRSLPHTSLERKTMSKNIQEEIKALKRLERHSKIERILGEFKGFKYVAGIKSRRKQKHATSMLDANGEEQTERQHIANIFSDFYAELYKTSRCTNLSTTLEDGSNIPLFTVAELNKELNSLKNNRCKDSSVS